MEIEQRFVGHFECDNCYHPQRVKIDFIQEDDPDDLGNIDDVVKDLACTKCNCTAMTATIRPANFELSMDFTCDKEGCGNEWKQSFFVWSHDDEGNEYNVSDMIAAVQTERTPCPRCKDKLTL